MYPHDCKIIYAVLNWGLGHATRSIPIINDLIQNNNEVIVASDGDALQFLQAYYPNLQFLELPGYNITYSRRKKQSLHLLTQLPKIVKAIQKEHAVVQEFLKENQLDWIMSDNRYGIYHKSVYSIFLGHQLSLISPMWYALLQKLHAKWINFFHECWVFDEEKYPLVPRLSSNPKVSIPLRYIGWRSRFQGKKYDQDKPKKYLYTAVVSGPEPQRSMFEHKIIHFFNRQNAPCAIVGGTFKEFDLKMDKNVKYYPNLQSEELWTLIQDSQKIIARSGYSSVMDYLISNTPVIYVPTPGQTEQEYVAKQLQKIHQAEVWKQSDL